MKRRTYLEVILTVNAVLLTGLILINVLDSRDVRGNQAVAQSSPTGFPNAAAQRAETNQLLRAMSAEIHRLGKDLRDTEFRVRVSSLPEGFIDGQRSRNARDKRDDEGKKKTQVSQITQVKDDSK